MVPPQIPPDPVEGSWTNTKTRQGNSPAAAAVPPTILVVGYLFPQVQVPGALDGAVVAGATVVAGAAVVAVADETGLTVNLQENLRAAVEVLD